MADRRNRRSGGYRSSGSGKSSRYGSQDDSRRGGYGSSAGRKSGRYGSQDDSKRGGYGSSTGRKRGRYGSQDDRRTDRHAAEQKRRPDTTAFTAQERTAEEDPNRIEGRNAVLETFRSGRSVDKLFVQADLHDGVVSSIVRLAREAGTVVSYVPKNRLDMMSETGSHQGVIAEAAAVDYVEVEDILKRAEEKGEKPFIFLLDDIEDPHNLGAIIRTANLAGAHGVIITRHHSVGLTAVVAKASAGAVNYTPVARVTNLAAVIDELKQKGIWFVCAAMDGTPMYDVDMAGAVGIVIGNEGSGVSRLVREKCDFTASIPMKGDIDSLNASVAAGVLAFEVVRQRRG